MTTNVFEKRKPAQKHIYIKHIEHIEHFSTIINCRYTWLFSTAGKIAKFRSCKIGDAILNFYHQCITMFINTHNLRRNSSET